MERRIIAFAGSAKSGKTEATNGVLEAAPQGTIIHRLSFGEPIKRMLRTGFGLTDEQLYGSQKETPIAHLGNVTPRHLMQTLGTEWGRELINPDIWVKVMAEKVRNLPPHFVVLIDDVRFDSEVQWLRSVNASIIGVERYPEKREISKLHVSEQLPPRFSKLGIPIVYNRGTIPELHQAVKILLQELDAM